MKLCPANLLNTINGVNSHFRDFSGFARRIPAAPRARAIAIVVSTYGLLSMKNENELSVRWRCSLIGTRGQRTSPPATGACVHRGRVTSAWHRNAQLDDQLP
jgi:hypothetical protein